MKITVHGRRVALTVGNCYVAVAGGGLALAEYGAGFPEARESLRARKALLRSHGQCERTVEGGETTFEMPCLSRESAMALMAACGSRRQSASPLRRRVRNAPAKRRGLRPPRR